MPKGKPFALADPDLRERLLDQIRAGHGRHAACKIVGISAGAYRNYIKAVPTFQGEVEDAVNASIEPVTRMLRDKALTEADTTAAKEYRQFIEREAPAATAKAKVEHTHRLDLGDVAAGQLEAVNDLAAQLANRRQAALPEGEIIDAEVIDDTVSDVPVQE